MLLYELLEKLPKIANGNQAEFSFSLSRTPNNQKNFVFIPGGGGGGTSIIDGGEDVPLDRVYDFRSSPFTQDI